jgi:hypothetical protein
LGRNNGSKQLFSPVVGGQIKLRRIDGWPKIAAVAE